MRKITVILISCFIIMCAAGAVLADDGSFAGMVDALIKEGTIPSTGGKITSFGDYEDSLTRMGSYIWFPIAEADNFVFSADMEWLSGSTTPTGSVSGCGLVYGLNKETGGHMLVSPRMDGTVHISGYNNYQYLYYVNYAYAYPSMMGSGKLTVIYQNDTVTVYLDDTLIANRVGLPYFGNGLGLAILSGTNMDFGTRCTFNDINLYSW